MRHVPIETKPRTQPLVQSSWQIAWYVWARWTKQIAWLEHDMGLLGYKLWSALLKQAYCHAHAISHPVVQKYMRSIDVHVREVLVLNYWIYRCNRYLVDQHVTNEHTGSPWKYCNWSDISNYHILRVEYLSDSLFSRRIWHPLPWRDQPGWLAKQKPKFNKTRLFKYHCTMIVYLLHPKPLLFNLGPDFPSRGRNENIGRQELVQCDSWCVNRALVPGNS